MYKIRLLSRNHFGICIAFLVMFSCTMEEEATLPIVTTHEVTEITQNSVFAGGTVISEGNDNVFTRGVCWSRSPNPTRGTINTTWVSRGIGSFSSHITSLEPSTTYYLRAYATNNVGTAYGEQVKFTTSVVTYKLTLNVLPSSYGEVSGAGEYPEGTVVSIAASAISNYNFWKWTNDSNYSTIASTPTTSITMPARDVSFNAYFTLGSDVNGYGAVTDINGNFYPTVIIGTQEWMMENLRVTRYNDGTPIRTGYTDNEWWFVGHGAYAIIPHTMLDGLNSEAEVLKAYGALYNRYTVNTEKLCPTGWHVPSKAEWEILIDYAGGKSIAGGKLKSTRTFPDAHPRWDSPNVDATDEYGFNGLPSGWRNAGSGKFTNVGNSSLWWFSGEAISTTAFLMCKDEGKTYFTGFHDRDAVSVRCVRD